MTKIAFVCVGNAGRSQMATAFAERERSQRGREDSVNVVTGGTDPHAHVHENVITALDEVGIDISGRNPREITVEDVADAEYVVTMGCSIDDFVPDDWNGTTEAWNLEHPGSDDLDAVRSQRDEIQQRVEDFFDRIELSDTQR
ncbi:low molecular weight phosphatase family protein [Natrarchaeobius halalkaliphilus]|uniref:Low molecular weight phosphatase family protein n=1 Tax=Natrarchaeobius halalkaliphilus TaxID=1679091 RepID=A0A3N6LZ98_9EURY|nr:low molecular weight phosphatase family protein [Natrarchaeobius halalkaliphilus]RQG93234.1 low molecular weight phosphatase family protein [Natrarchaeobius halalkaliphilus]